VLMNPPPTASASPSFMGPQQTPQMLQSPAYKAQYLKMQHPTLNAGMATSMGSGMTPGLGQGMPGLSQPQQPQQNMQQQQMIAALQGGR
jgi:hypothetical protein